MAALTSDLCARLWPGGTYTRSIPSRSFTVSSSDPPPPPSFSQRDNNVGSVKLFLERTNPCTLESPLSAISRCGIHKRNLLKARMVVTPYPSKTGKPRWLLHPPPYERGRPVIVALLNESNAVIDRLLIFRNIPFKKTKVLESSGWLQSGIPLKQTSDLLRIIGELREKESLAR